MIILLHVSKRFLACSACTIWVCILWDIKTGTRKKKGIRMLLTWNLWARFKGVSSVTRWAGADGLMIDGITDSIDSTSTLARIQTLLPDASLVGRTLTIDKTLWMTVRRLSKVTLLTAADHSRAFQFTHWVRSTRAREAGLCRLVRFNHNSWNDHNDVRRKVKLPKKSWINN